MAGILHICTGRDWGGLERYVAQTIHWLRQEGLPQTALLARGSPLDRALDMLAAEASPDGRWLQRLYGDSRRIFALPAQALRLRRWIRQNRPAAVHVHTTQDLRLGSWACRGVESQKGEGGGRRPILLLSVYIGFSSSRKDPWHRLLYKRVDGVACASERYAALFRKNLPVAPEKVVVVPYGRDLSFCQKDDARRRQTRQKLGLPADAFVVGCMSRLDPAKGILELIRAAGIAFPEIRISRPLRLLIAGGPTRPAPPYTEYEDACRREAERIGQVMFLGNREDPLPLLEAMDLFVLPSYEETYSLAVLDAMGMGVPVIGTNSGGTPEQIRPGETGWLVPPKDEIGLAEGLKMAAAELSRPGRAEEMALACRRWVEANHSKERFLARLRALYGM